jgi:hypothetical protein
VHAAAFVGFFLIPLAGGAGVQIVRDWVLRFNAEAPGH